MGGSLVEAAGGLTVILVAIGFQLLLNSAILWFVLNHIMDKKKIGNPTFGRCFLCTVGLIVAVLVSALCLLIPLPVLNLVFFLVAVFKLSTLVIEATFELMSGGFIILIVYWLTQIAISYLVRSALS
jgi:hypothetical protein